MDKRTNLILLGLIAIVNAIMVFVNWPESPRIAILQGLMAVTYSFLARRASKS